MRSIKFFFELIVGFLLRLICEINIIVLKEGRDKEIAIFVIRKKLLDVIKLEGRGIEKL